MECKVKIQHSDSSSECIVVDESRARAIVENKIRNTDIVAISFKKNHKCTVDQKFEKLGKRINALVVKIIEEEKASKDSAVKEVLQYCINCSKDIIY